MSEQEILIFAIFVVTSFGLVAEWRRWKKREYLRLLCIRELEEELKQSEYKDVENIDRKIVVLDALNDKLGKAGFFTDEERHDAKLIRLGILCISTIIGASLGMTLHPGLGAMVGALVGLYMGVVAWVVYLQRKIKEQERQVLFFTPLCLETLILLVESGLGILPALGNLVEKKEQGSFSNPPKRILKVVYDLSSNGISFGRALEMVSERVDYRVLKHVLLHLDISGNEGGELVPALRSLSDHALSQWKMTTETRVRLLENYSIFPVFGAIMGLLLLTAAVPTVTAFNALKPPEQINSTMITK